MPPVKAADRATERQNGFRQAHTKEAGESTIKKSQLMFSGDIIWFF